MPSSPNPPEKKTSGSFSGVTLGKGSRGLFLPRLYAILDVAAVVARGRAPADVASAWLDAGVRLIQLRAKQVSMGAMLRLAEPLVDMCHRSDAALVINDRADVARIAGADGVHVGQDDLAPSEALSVFPDARLLGHSTHTLDQLRAGLSMPATYLAFGPVFATASKDRPDPVVGLDGLRSAVECATNRPVVAIGGMTLATAPAALDAGATSIAVISDLLADDPGRRARAWLAALA